MIGSPQDLEYFMEVTRTLNLTRAAERLGVTQPILSLTVRRPQTLSQGA
ncbi:MAG: LysR family transcriptional regulator [Proteobacteria bacterium]|nr:LysR family transcriptional regulator [Pseudomonadota bacterium]